MKPHRSKEMLSVKIKRMDLEIAFEQNEEDATACLDTKDGKVTIIDIDSMARVERLLNTWQTAVEAQNALQADEYLASWEREYLITILHILVDSENRYRSIPMIDRQYSYNEMQEHISTLDDEDLRQQLEVATTGKGVFRRFKTIVNRYPEVEAMWFKFRAERQDQRIAAWLDSEGIEAEFE
jgi:hypothetical protein